MSFLFVTCQIGAEQSVKTELKRRWPGFRFAYSRPGFLTFRITPEPNTPEPNTPEPDAPQPGEAADEAAREAPPERAGLLADFDLESVFARAYGFSLGGVEGASFEDLAEKVWEVYGSRPVRGLHVWQRDMVAPGRNDNQPALTPMAREAHEAIRKACPRPEELCEGADDPARRGRPGEWVLDCILVEPRQWWVGYHRVRSFASQWPGGSIPLELPPEAVSRAWLKMEEALAWSELPLQEGARCMEIGSAPGGASQALLDRGFVVTGIDPAAMHAAVLEHPNFTHLRARAAQVRRREFRKTRWLMADMNVTPSYTCDVVESIVTHPEVQVRGMLLTLKLFTQEHADRLPEYVERVRQWGYNILKARQLHHNRQEACISALRKPFRRKSVRCSS